MIKIKKFRHVGIVVNNFEKMLDFYSNTLGFKVLKKFEIESSDFRKGVGICNAKAKVAHLAITESVDLEMFEYNENIICQNKDNANTEGFSHIALYVENLEETYKYLEDKNIEFISEPITITEPITVAGFKFVYFKDPEGNIIELNQEGMDSKN